ncbi:MAG TPA: primosomal protein N' [Actinomycetota bacterium]|nr:primosomal protein N' [Actinomycetota bacterium]
MSSGDSAPRPPDRVSVVPLVPAWRVDRAYSYTVPEKLRGKLAVGSLVRVPFGGRNVRGIVVDGTTPVSEAEDLLDVKALVVDEPLTPPPLDRLLAWVAERYVTPRSICLQRTIPPRVRVEAPPPEPLAEAPIEGGHVARLRGGRSLLDAISDGGSGTWVLRPIPSADRGELVAELVNAAAGTGGAVLVAVPEVRYGAAVIETLGALWPAARVDSAQEDADRARAWLRLARGHGLGVGGRSVVFAPAPALRLIVIDESHHVSYKEDRSPRYDARRVAVERARLQGAVCVLVSPTPSVEHGALAASGRWGSVHPDRADKRAARPLPEHAPPPADRVLGGDLHARMARALHGGGRVGLLSTRRGFARTLWCAACRRSLRCPVCEAGLAYDRTPRRVRCVRCGFASEPPDACPSCDATEWLYLGAGTERLAEQLRKAFPHADVARMDPDVLAEGPPDADAKPDVYLTTWIGTKPSLRPDVSLVGVLDADAWLRRPDWRAPEDAYQALVAMSEWAGPAAAGGRLFLQTREPSHHAIQAVIRGDYDFFLERELEARRELGYPPYSELVKLSATGAEAPDLMAAAVEVCRSAGARVLGPITTRPPGAAEDELQALVKCRDALEVTPGLRGILARARPGSRLRVDVDPR